MPHDPAAHERIDGLIGDVAALKTLGPDVAEIKSDIKAIKQALADKPSGTAKAIVEVLRERWVVALIVSLASAALGAGGHDVAQAMVAAAVAEPAPAPVMAPGTPPATVPD